MACNHSDLRYPGCAHCGARLRKTYWHETLRWTLWAFWRHLSRIPQVVLCGYGLHPDGRPYCRNCGAYRGT